MIELGQLLVKKGAVLSTKFIICRQELLNPELGSEAVQVLDITCEPLHVPEFEMISLKLTVGIPQLAPPEKADAFPVTDGLGTLVVGQAEYVDGQLIEGGAEQVGTEQLTVIVNESVLLFPHASTAVYTTVVDPAEKV